MPSEIARLFSELGDLKRRVAGAQHQGSVHEVKGDKMRVVWGKNPDGEDVLSPWLDSSDHRGGARERRFYKKGQNVTVATVNGDMNEAATVSADAPNDQHKAPDHADAAGEEAETYQLSELGVTKKNDTYEVFLGDAKNSEHKLRFNKSGGITGRVGEARFHAHKDGVKLRFGDAHYLVITKDGIFASGPITLGADPIPNDDD